MSVSSSSNIFDWTHPSRSLQKWFDPFENLLLYPFQMRKRREAEVDIKQTSEKFQACIDVKHFRPDEISVKIVDNQVEVEGKHEEKEDPCGYVSRHFLRKYPIPENHDPKDVFSTLSIDGFLTVVIPKKNVKQEGQVNVPIVMTGPLHPVAAVKPAENKPETQAAKMEDVKK